MTDYWVDPLDGDAANSGTTYTAALSSFVDIFNGNLSGGITRGDRVFLMATTGDNADVSITVPVDDGAYSASQGIEGTTMGWRQFRGVNPSTLQEDGTKYILGTRNNQYASMIGKMERLCFYNIGFVGHFHVYTSGNGGVIFRYCIFSDGHPLIQDYTGPIRSVYMGNAGHSFSECLFINRGYNSNHTQAIRSGGSVYSNQQDYTNCEFRGFEDEALYLDNNSLLYNCRFIDNGVGQYQTYNMNRASKSHTTNCFYENNGTDFTKIQHRVILIKVLQEQPSSNWDGLFKIRDGHTVFLVRHLIPVLLANLVLWLVLLMHKLLLLITAVLEFFFRV